ncbi:unnamed protein product [Linum trigynum]|uniref:Uncharacterized protein n=1 Tax=Linum trigynum TaxID=586398 RepID=A0AAV2GX71_9ROSI
MSRILHDVVLRSRGISSWWRTRLPLRRSFLRLQSFPHRLRASQAQHLPQSTSPGPALSKIQIEDSVKKLESPKTSPGPALSKTQIDSAVEHLTNWVYESCVIVSFSNLEHPKF